MIDSVLQKNEDREGFEIFMQKKDNLLVIKRGASPIGTAIG
jgi:hypothetical protein